MTRHLRKLAVLAGVAGIFVAFAAPAGAHIEIEPSSAPAGSDAVLSFAVPNEIDGASTTKIVVTFPAEHPIADAAIEPVAGWTAKVDTTSSATPIKTDSGTVNERVSQITWSGGEIAAGGFQRFTISVGLPDSGPLVFKTLQTYSDGTTVSWIQDIVAGQEVPEHPAPVLALTAAESGANATPAHVAAKSDVDSAKTLGIIGVILGALALIIAVLFGLMSRRSSPTPQ
jgi:uncharacterized protein YcnI